MIMDLMYGRGRISEICLHWYVLTLLSWLSFFDLSTCALLLLSLRWSRQIIAGIHLRITAFFRGGSRCHDPSASPPRPIVEQLHHNHSGFPRGRCVPGVGGRCSGPFARRSCVVGVSGRTGQIDRWRQQRRDQQRRYRRSSGSVLIGAIWWEQYAQ